MSKINNNLISIPLILAFILSLSLTSSAYAISGTVDSGVTFDTDYSSNSGFYPSYNSGYNYNDYNGGIISNLKPVIYSLNPSSINRSSGPVTVAISGNYFVPGAIAKWNGSNRTTTFINSNYLQMQLNNSDTNGLGDYIVTVYNPTPGGGYSNAATLTIIGTQVNGPLPSSTSNQNTVSSVRKTSTTTTTSVPIVTTPVTNYVPPTTTPETNNTGNTDLGANALSAGTKSFFPSSIIQWLLLLILILLTIVLWRKIYVSNQEREIPLKHA